MVVSFLREGRDGRKTRLVHRRLYNFEGSKIQSFALPYLLTLIVFFLLAKQALMMFP